MRLLSLAVVLAGCASQSSSPPPAAPAPSAAVPASADTNNAQMVPPSFVEGHRVKGSIMIAPDDLDKWKMVERKVTRLTYSAKLCITTAGRVGSMSVLQPSAVPAFDDKIRRIVSDWEYSPFQINGQPAEVCTQLNIIYNQPLPERRP